MAASTRFCTETTTSVKSVCSIVIKGHWDTLLKPKIGSFVTSTIINQLLITLSKTWFSLSWSFFKWVESVPGYKPSLSSSWTMICILAKEKHFKAGQSMLEKIALKEFMSSPTVLNSIVSNQDDPEVNAHVLSWLVIIYAKSKMTRDAISVFEHMRMKGFKPHLHSCTVLLNSLVKDRMNDTVSKLYKKMIRAGVVPNLHLYNVLIHSCCKSGDVAKAEAFLSEMELKGVFPDLITYNTLISLYCKKGMHYEALSVQDRMERAGVCPDIVMYNSLIYSFCQQGRMREALRLFKDIKDATPNEITYTTLIDGYCRANDLDSALQLRDVMEAKGLYPGVVTYNSILRKLCEEGRLRDANRLLNEMSGKKVEPDNITCNTLINAYCKIQDIASALRVKHRMQESGLKPDSYTFKALIHGFCKVQDVQSAIDTLFEMINSGFSPNYSVFSWIVDYYCHHGNERAVINLLDALSSIGGLSVDDKSVYRAVIRSLCKREKIECALTVFDTMNQKGIPGDALVYTSLAYACFKAGDVVYTLKLFDEMYKRRLMVTMKIYSTFNGSYPNEKSVSDLFWKEMLQKGLISKTIYTDITQK